MTEAEWLAEDDPDELLEYVCGLRRTALGLADSDITDELRHSEFHPRVYHRKRRLFACACCYRLGAMLPEVARAAIQVAERFADGAVGEAERAAAEAAVEAVGNAHDDDRAEAGPDWTSQQYALKAAGGTVLKFKDVWECTTSRWYGRRPFLNCDETDGGFTQPANDALRALVTVEHDPQMAPLLLKWNRLRRGNIMGADAAVPKAKWYTELVTQCNLLRDIFGNPFRPVTVDPAWLTATVVSLATAIYDDRAFDRLPILADALEDAGCTHEEILNHCREPGEHARGCWVVDCLLGKT